MTSSEDPRRQRPIEVKWVGEMAKSKRGSILIDGEVWAYAHWSQGRQVWCIQDAEGECQVHVYAEVKGRDNRSTAVTLVEAMIRGGSLPSPEELTARRERETQQRREQTAEYERRSKLTAAERAAAYEASLSQTPSAVRARAERREREERSNQLRDQKWAAERRDVQAAPLWMALADAFDFADPNLWRSNSFASLRPRLVLYLQRVVAKLEYDMHEAGKRQKRWGRPAEPVELSRRRVAAIAPRLARAREILGLIETEDDRLAAAISPPPLLSDPARVPEALLEIGLALEPTE